MGTDIITTKPKTAEQAAASASAAMAMDDDDSDSDEPGANLPPELRALINENPFLALYGRHPSGADSDYDDEERALRDAKRAELGYLSDER